MRKAWTKRLLSLVLVVSLVAGLALPASATDTAELKVTQIDNSAVSAGLPNEFKGGEEDTLAYEDTDVVRVSIVLEKASTIAAGYPTEGIAENAGAMAYRGSLKAAQNAIARKISTEALKGAKLDTVWNLTLAANIISANVPFGAIDDIKAVKGVKDVLIENRYEPDVVSKEEAADPNMSTSSAMIGSNAAYAAGYTGAGSRIAVIDTGTDNTHQSLSAAAYQYSLAYQAGLNQMTVDEYVESLDLLDTDEIAAKMDQLNIASILKASNISADQLYLNAKLPFAFNYVDENLDTTHANDGQGEHGSHVAGIATANRFIQKEDGTFVSALDAVKVQGVAPDAQLITMKVFGTGGGAYDSDYMVAIEDAIILGCDSVNLSLGSGNPGVSYNTTEAYQAILESLVDTDTVVTMSAGNSGHWAEQVANPAALLYATDVSLAMTGNPGAYTNALSVASVDNDGFTGEYYTIGDQTFFYVQTAYSNAPLSTLAGEQEYVLIDGFGTAEDFAAVGDALVGKIAACSRGSTSFYQKAEEAVKAGAIGTIIYNNQPGTINMDLTDYTKTAPVISITQADGAAMKAAATPVTDAEGNVLYYTGKMTIAEGIDSISYGSEYYTMSTFSSWGIPGSLEMKPEITAPGGNIYSLHGYASEDGKNFTGGPDQYESMSGTSMAAPQVTGMAAVVAQYIRENGLAEKTGLSVRALANSLLMSTATPLREEASEGNYYSILNQGSGLANVGNAVSADSYILMADGQNAGAADGKVKVELGDDPDRTGSYTVSFSINNLTDKELNYNLIADMFTQDVFPYYVNENQDVGYYMDTWTTPLTSKTTWVVDGKEVHFDFDTAELDVNGDGKVDSADAQAILDYVTGKEVEINEAAADVDGNGKITSYDAHLLLVKLHTGVVTVAPNGKVDVTATIELTAEQKAELDAMISDGITNGSYIEGFVKVEPATTEEGAKGVTHSIPVIGFYGNWTDPSMYEVGSYVEYATGMENRAPYLGDMDANSVGITYGDRGDSQFFFGTNPIDADSTFHPERTSVNAVRGDAFATWSIGLIRNAAGGRFTMKNLTTNETIAEKKISKTDSAYYYTNGAKWQRTKLNFNVGQLITGAEEGETLEVALTMAPEYYWDPATNTIDFDSLGKGATQSYVAVVDNTAPVLDDVAVSLNSNSLKITTTDNRYVAGAMLFNGAGTKLLDYALAADDAKEGETVTLSIPLEGINGKKFLLQVCDYAMNTTTFEIETQIGEEAALPDMIAYDAAGEYWTSLNTSSAYPLEPYCTTNNLYFAGTIVDHIVFASTDNGDLYVMPEDDLTNETYVGNMGEVLIGMAYNKADGKLYGLDSYANLFTIDKLTGELTKVGPIGVDALTLACDGSGTFYCNEFLTSKVYSFTLDTIDAPELLCEVGEYEMANVQAMAVDPNTGKLIWTSYYTELMWGFIEIGYAYLFEIDTKTGEFVQHNDVDDELTTLLIPERTSGGSWTAPVDYVSGIQISTDKTEILAGSNIQLTATVQPWTATDRTVTWTSSNENVATVDANGVVTGVSEGTATITATANLDNSYTATCEVTVNTIKTTLKGAIQDAEGNPSLFTWNLETERTWTPGVALETSIDSVARDTKNKTLFVCDAAENTWAMHKIDEATGANLETYANSTGIPLWDMQYSEVFSTPEKPIVNGIYYYYFLAGQDPTNLNTMCFGLEDYLANYSGADFVVAVTTLGHEQVEDEDTGELLDTEAVLMLDNAGMMWIFNIYNTAEGMSAFLNFAPTNMAEFETFPGYENDMYCSMVADEAGNLYLSAFNGTTNNLYYLQGSMDTGYNATYIGNVGDEVWPAALYAAEANVPAPEEGGEAIRTVSHDSIIKAENVSAEELAAAAANANSKGLSRVDNSKKDSAGVTSEPVTGSLNAVTVSNGNDKQIDKQTRGTAANKVCSNDISLTITADKATTNGLLTVKYDTAAAEFAGCTSKLALTSVNDKEGTITFAYAAEEEIAEGAELATLTFTAKVEGEITFQVTRTEDGAESVEVAETIAAHSAHVWNEGVVTTEPTCTEAGVRTYTCTICGETQTSEVEALGHEVVVDKAVEANCTETGLTEGSHCGRCNVVLVEQEVVPAKGHRFGEWKVTKEATCTEKGEETQTCYDCGETVTREIATTDHSYGEWKVTKEATCTEKGEETRTCSACGATETREIATLGHEIVVDPAVEATCTTEGKTVGVHCGRCNEVIIKPETIPAKGHAWDEGKVTKEATEDAAGEKTFTCTVCGETKTEEIPALTCPSAQFTDVSRTAWYHEAIDWAVANKVLNGVSDQSFAPQAATNRAMIVTTLWRMEGEPEATKESPFTDLTAGSYYEKAVVWAAENGIVNGRTETTFAPSANVTRQETATILCRYAAFKGIEIKADAEALKDFPDADKVAKYAKEPMAWAVSQKLINGKRDTQSGVNYLAPTASTTRAELATMLMNLVNNVVNAQ